jgi:hypothetical protein
MNGSRAWNIQSFRDLQVDFDAKDMPQFAFITPNMIHDGHNASLSDSMSWTHDFLKPMLANDAFMEKTLIMLTYDESEDYGKPNKIVTLLLGNAIPDNLKGTKDNTFYTHYSMLSTVQFNWGLPNLGRYDVGANIFQWVQDSAVQVAIPNRDPPNADKVDNSVSYAGPLNNSTRTPYPPPNTDLNGASGQPVLQAVRLLWSAHKDSTPYEGTGEVYDASHPPPKSS